jgi:hypothetical protein
MKEESKIDKKYISKAGLKARGWTDSMIRRLLGDPDLTVRNPYYRKAPEMKLYLIERVNRIEGSDIFLELKEKSMKRREAMKKVAKMKESELLKYVDSIEIEVEKMEIEKIKKLAIENYNFHQGEIDHIENMIFSEKDLDNAFLSRIMVNYIRHNLTNYEDLLEELEGKVGKINAYIKLKNKILKKIAEVYPDLKDECYNQMR